MDIIITVVFVSPSGTGSQTSLAVFVILSSPFLKALMSPSHVSLPSLSLTPLFFVLAQGGGLAGSPADGSRSKSVPRPDNDAAELRTL